MSLKQINPHFLRQFSTVGTLFCIFGSFLLVKLNLFQALEYGDDIYNSVQISLSLSRGWSLFFYNNIGPCAHLHNYFLLLLQAPMIERIGAIGFLLVYILLLPFGLICLRSKISAAREFYLPMLVVVAGPIGFWLWDSPYQGWNTELLYLPLTLLLSITLVVNSRFAWLWGTFMVLNKEDGPLLVGIILILWLLMKEPLSTSRFEWKNWFCRHRYHIVCIAGATIILFAGNLYMLHLLSPCSDNRLLSALQLISQMLAERTHCIELLAIIMRTILLLFSGWIAFSFLVTFFQFLILLGITTPLIIIGLIGGAAYGINGPSYLGPTWTERFVEIWSCLIAVGIFSFRQNSPNSIRSMFSSQLRFIVVSVLSCIMQGIFLLSFCEYNLIDRVFRAGLNLWPSESVVTLEPAERRLLGSLAQTLNKETLMMVDERLQFWFQLHNTITPRGLMLANVSPSVGICSNAPWLSPLTPEGYCEKLFRNANYPVVSQCKTNHLEILFVEDLPVTFDKSVCY